MDQLLNLLQSGGRVFVKFCGPPKDYVLKYNLSRYPKGRVLAEFSEGTIFELRAGGSPNYCADLYKDGVEMFRSWPLDNFTIVVPDKKLEDFL